MKTITWSIVLSTIFTFPSCNKTHQNDSSHPTGDTEIKSVESHPTPLPNSPREEFQELFEGLIRKSTAATGATGCFFRKDNAESNYTEYFEAVGMSSQIYEDRLEESDKLNGVEFSGRGELSCTSVREGKINNSDGSFGWQPYQGGKVFLIVRGRKVNGNWDTKVDGSSGGFFPNFVAEDSTKKVAEEKPSGTVINTFKFKNGYVSGQITQDVNFRSGSISIHNKGIIARSDSQTEVSYVPFVRIRELTFQKYTNGERGIRIYFDYRDGSMYGFLDMDFSSNETAKRAAAAIYSTYNTWKENASGLNPPRVFSNKISADNFD